MANLTKAQFAPFIENTITVTINEPTFHDTQWGCENFEFELEYSDLLMAVHGVAEIKFTRRGEWTIEDYRIENITVTDLDTISYQVTNYQCKQLCKLFYAEI